jgi:hypothetical protein
LLAPITVRAILGLVASAVDLRRRVVRRRAEGRLLRSGPLNLATATERDLRERLALLERASDRGGLTGAWMLYREEITAVRRRLDAPPGSLSGESATVNRRPSRVA